MTKPDGSEHEAMNWYPAKDIAGKNCYASFDEGKLVVLTPGTYRIDIEDGASVVLGLQETPLVKVWRMSEVQEVTIDDQT